MLESLVLPTPAAAEPSKSAEGRPGSAGTLKSQKDNSTGFSTSAFAYAGEELRIRVASRDGDVLEIRRSFTVAAGYNRSGSHCGDVPCADEAQDVKGAKEDRNSLHDAMKWVREVTHELEKQQAQLLETLLKGSQEGGAEENRFVMFGFVLVGGGAVAEGEDGASGVPEYWNAENTSDRIVAFATSFAGVPASLAGIHGDSEFGKKMMDAVLEGFEQAGAILGELPGAAGKLHRETKDLVFAKLDKWLEAWESGAYNQEARNVVLEPALEA